MWHPWTLFLQFIPIKAFTSNHGIGVFQHEVGVVLHLAGSCRRLCRHYGFNNGAVWKWKHNWLLLLNWMTKFVDVGFLLQLVARVGVKEGSHKSFNWEQFLERKRTRKMYVFLGDEAGERESSEKDGAEDWGFLSVSLDLILLLRKYKKKTMNLEWEIWNNKDKIRIWR